MKTSTAIATFAFGAAAMIGPAWAQTDMKAAFGNTIVTTYPDQKTALLWLQPDGSYTASGRRRTASSGRWEVKDEKICLRQQRPLPVPFTYCADLSDGSVARGWNAKAVSGEPVRVTIVKGIVR